MKSFHDHLPGTGTKIACAAVAALTILSGCTVASGPTTPSHQMTSEGGYRVVHTEQDRAAASASNDSYIYFPSDPNVSEGEIRVVHERGPPIKTKIIEAQCGGNSYRIKIGHGGDAPNNNFYWAEARGRRLASNELAKIVNWIGNDYVATSTNIISCGDGTGARGRLDLIGRRGPLDGPRYMNFWISETGTISQVEED